MLNEIRDSNDFIRDAFCSFGFLPLKIESNPLEGELVYTGIADCFDLLQKREAVPEYYIYSEPANDGGLIYTAERKDT